MFEEPVLMLPETLPLGPVLNSYYDDEPIGEPGPSSGPSIQYTGDGVVVVGTENVNGGELMFVTDANGALVGLAFGNGDGNWDNEVDALENGLGCVLGVGITAYSSGALAWLTGAATAVTCGKFLYDLGNLYGEWATSPPSYSYVEKTYFLEDHGWDSKTTYNYGHGSWSIYYDDDTGTYSDWEWKENTIQEGG